MSLFGLSTMTQHDWEQAIIADPADALTKLAFADWLQDHGGEPADSELCRLVRWMADDGVEVWPQNVIDGYCFWDIAAAAKEGEWDYSWFMACRIESAVFQFLGQSLRKSSLVSYYYTLLDALRAYYSAHQARQLMQDGTHVARVPREVAVCPVCGHSLMVEANEWIDEGEAKNLPTRSGLYVGCGDDIHRHWQGEWMPAIAAVARWCHAVD